MIREILFVIAILVLTASAGFFIFEKSGAETVLLADVSDALPVFARPQANLPENGHLLLYAVGDIMLNRGVEYMIETYGANDFKFPFLKITEQLQEADIVFGNLEGPISGQGRRVGSIYSFRFKPAAAQALRFVGFNVLSLANNAFINLNLFTVKSNIKRLAYSFTCIAYCFW